MASFSFAGWLNANRARSLLSGRASRRGRHLPGHRFLPRLEVLEDRSLPSTLMVTNLSDTGVSGDGSLRGEILAASSGDTIGFAHGLHGTITLNSLKGDLPISKSVTINGPGANKLSVSGNDASRIFDISGSASVTIAGLTITDGRATTGGGILLEGSAALSISKCTLTDNEALGSLAGSLTVPDGDGGGIEDNSSGAMTVANSTFDTNKAIARGPNAPPSGPNYIIALGGAIDVSLYSTGPATISDSTFTGNQALGGVPGASAGGGALSDSSTPADKTLGATMIVTGCTLSGNAAIGAAGGDGVSNFGSGQGGGINNFANLIVSDSTLTGNLAEQATNVYGDREDGVHPGDVVFDCGANIGVYTRVALAAGAKLVLAIEPAPENVECLRRNYAAEIGQGRVIVVPKGVWDREDVLTLRVDAGSSARDSFVGSFGPALRGIHVPLTTIDRLVEELNLTSVGFMKLDIEGAEKNALAGARNTLLKYHPRMAIAMEHLPDDPVRIPQVILAAAPSYQVACGDCVDEITKVRPDVLFFR